MKPIETTVKLDQRSPFGRIAGTEHGGPGRNPERSLIQRIFRARQLYILLLPAIVYIIIFQYIPMYGASIAFKAFNPYKGILGSDWVGFKNFIRFFDSPSFWAILWNTFSLSVYQLIAGFPIPIILAIALNSIRGRRFAKSVQMVTYAPHFISTVVLVGMLAVLLSPSYGLVNNLIAATGHKRIFFMALPGDFQSLYVWSGVWQSMGWSSIIFLASLSAIDPELHEAAIVDGATLLRRIWSIDLPGILPTIAILLILNVGRVMSLGFEKAYLMQNALNIGKSEIIATYVYKIGLLDAQYSFGAAVGLFNAVINFVLLVLVNRIVKTMGQSGLW